MKDKINIGIFFGYQPRVRMGTEGLGRYIANLIRGFVDAGNEVTIACPKWMLSSLFDIFDEFNISESSVNFITSQRMPVLWNLYEWLEKRKHKQHRRKRKILLTGCANLIEWVIGKLVNITSVLIFVVFMLICITIGLILLPFIALLFLGYMLYRLFYAIITRGKFTIHGFVMYSKSIFEKFSASGYSIDLYFVKRMTDSVIEELIKKINRSNEDIWFIPAIFWPQVNNIRKVTVINAPDLVTSEFPHGFARFVGEDLNTMKCAKTIEEGHYFITYCEFLKHELLVNQFGKQEDHVIAIPHADNSMKGYLTFNTGLELPYVNSCENEKTFARLLMCDLAKYASQENQEYLSKFDFRNVRFIFYASQLRPNKNIFNLIRAYEYLLRKRDVKVKLFLTCDLSNIPEIQEYVSKKRLQYDVITFKGIPAQILAALYKCAELVVNPTLYEGGFPFTFGEGMSVGTPSVMSKIPQVTYMTDHYDVEEMLFDPYDVKDIAEKIIFGLENREVLYKKEKELYYGEFKRRTNLFVAGEYIEAFRYFLKLHREEEHREDA